MFYRVISSVTSIAALAGLGACSGGMPGSDATGVKYQSRALPVLQALEAYENDHSALPQALDELAPAYIDHLPQHPELSFDAKTRQLSFSYSPPLPRIGKINCSSQLGSGQWNCQGYL